MRFCGHYRFHWWSIILCLTHCVSLCWGLLTPAQWNTMCQLLRSMFLMIHMIVLELLYNCSFLFIQIWWIELYYGTRCPWVPLLWWGSFCVFKWFKLEDICFWYLSLSVLLKINCIVVQSSVTGLLYLSCVFVLPNQSLFIVFHIVRIRKCLLFSRALLCLFRPHVVWARPRLVTWTDMLARAGRWH